MPPFQIFAEMSCKATPASADLTGGKMRKAGASNKAHHTKSSFCLLFIFSTYAKNYIHKFLKNMKVNYINNFNILNTSYIKNKNNKTKNNSFNANCTAIQPFYHYLNFTANKPIYAATYMGDYTRFDSILQAANQLGIDKDSLYTNLGKNLQSINNLVFIRANQVEYTNENNETVLDVIKLNKMILAKNNWAVYAIDQDGNFRRFDTCASAAREFEVFPGNILSCINGRTKSIKGHAFIKASELEYINEQGKIELDRRNQKILEFLEHTKIKYGIYAVDEDANYIRFDNAKDASIALQTSDRNIYSCLLGHSRAIKGYVLIRANEVESINENNEIELDAIKLKKIFIARDDNSVYLSTTDGKYKKYKNGLQASNEIGCTHQNFSQCLSGVQNKVKGYYIIKAKDIETVNEQGQIVVDVTELKRILISRDRRSIYVFDPTGQYNKYSSLREASEKSGIPYGEMSYYLKEHKRNKTGYFFIKANEIETVNDDGEIELKRELIK